MSELCFTQISIPGSPLDDLNPYPQLPGVADKAFQLTVNDDIPERLRKHLGYGVSSAPMDPCLPYLLQDDYSRELRPLTLRCAKLSNEKIEATILLENGARIWKLWDKVNKRDLVYENPVFQPCNFAVRNAWVAGGIEWNVGVRGHSVFTVDKLFTGTLEGPDGEPILRVWEYERTRKLVFQIDFFLCGDEAKLAVHVGVCNTTDHVLPLYWWSNVAIREQPGHRVVAHGGEAICNAYGGRLSIVDADAPPDLSYLENHDHVGDYFYFGKQDEQAWIAAVDAGGYGLYQTSTLSLQGRKIFAWGRSLAARNWQKMLSHESIPYFEIQAGVAPTQYGSEPLDGGARVEWIECYGPIQVDPTVAASGSPDELRSAAADIVLRDVPAKDLEDLLLQRGSTFDRAPDKLVSLGSGWGALELLANGREDHWENLPGARFPKAGHSDEQAPWIQVLHGKKPDLHPDHPHPSFMIDPSWMRRIDAAHAPETAWSHLQRGIASYAAGYIETAEAHFTDSLHCKSSATAHVCLAQHHRNSGEHSQALAHVRKAVSLKPNDKRLHVLLANALIEAGKAIEALEQIKQYAGTDEPRGRLRIAAIAAHVQAGHLSEARALLMETFDVPDLREAESKLGQLWDSLNHREVQGDLVPCPEHLIFVADPYLVAQTEASHSLTQSQTGNEEGKSSW